MGPTVVVEADPLCDDTRGVLLGFEAVTMNTLLFQRPDNPFDHAVLLRAVRGDELLSKPMEQPPFRPDSAVVNRS